MRSYLRRIRILNFKSFGDVEVKLGNFNVFIGANASGKTNFINAITFLSEISKNGLQVAIGDAGGNYLTNLKDGKFRDIGFEIELETHMPPSQYSISPSEAKLTKVTSLNFAFSFKLTDSTGGYEITKDILVIKYKLLTVKEPQDNSYPDRWKLIYGKDVETVRYTNQDFDQEKEIQISRKQEEQIETNRDIFEYHDIEDEDIQRMIQFWTLSLRKEKLLLEAMSRMPLEPFIFDIPVYNFDPKALRKHSPIPGRTELGNDGSNLPMKIDHIMSNAKKSCELTNFLTDILPFVKDVKTEKSKLGDSVDLRIREEYFQPEYLPSFLSSDGTMNITALLVALFFDNLRMIAVFEEPERNIHPSLFSKIVSFMKEVSTHKQIIMTTHNPEIIRHANPNDIFLVSRDKNGLSSITKPIEKQEIKEFLENDLGLAELYVQDLLSA